MTPHPHFTPTHAQTLLTAVARHVLRPSLDGRKYWYAGSMVIIVREDDDEVIIATVDRRPTLPHRTGQKRAMLTVPRAVWRMVAGGRVTDMGAGQAVNSFVFVA